MCTKINVAIYQNNRIETLTDGGIYGNYDFKSLPCFNCNNKKELMRVSNQIVFKCIELNLSLNTIISNSTTDNIININKFNCSKVNG